MNEISIAVSEIENRVPNGYEENQTCGSHHTVFPISRRYEREGSGSVSTSVKGLPFLGSTFVAF